MRAWLLSSHWQHPSCSTGRAHSSAPATLAPAVPAPCLRACARCPVPLCCPTLCRTGGVSVRAPRPPTLACKTGRTTPPAGPRSTRPDLCPAGAPCTGASHGQRGCNGWAEPVPPRGLQMRVLWRAPGSPVRASALRICSRPGGDYNPSCPRAATLCPPGNGSALPAGPFLAPRDGRGQCRPSWGGPLVAWMGMRSSGRPVGAPSPRTTGRLPLLSRDAPRRQGPQEAPFRQARSPRADAPCLLARPRLPGRPTLRRTVCRWTTRGPLGLPVSAHVMRGEHTLLRASSLLPGLAPGLGGLLPVRRAPAAVDALPRVGRLCALAPPVCSAVAVGILASATPPGGCLSVRPGPTLMAGLTAPRCAPALAPALVGSHCAPALLALGYAGVCSPSLRLPPARPAAALRPAVTAGSAAALLCMVRAVLLSALVRPLPLPAALEGLL